MTDEQQLNFVYRISGLLYKYVNQHITETELTELYNWAYASKANQALFEDLSDENALRRSLGQLLKIDRAGALRQVLDKLSMREPGGREPIRQ